MLRATRMKRPYIIGLIHEILMWFYIKVTLLVYSYKISRETARHITCAVNNLQIRESSTPVHLELKSFNVSHEVSRNMPTVAYANTCNDTCQWRYARVSWTWLRNATQAWAKISIDALCLIGGMSFSRSLLNYETPREPRRGLYLLKRSHDNQGLS